MDSPDTPDESASKQTKEDWIEDVQSYRAAGRYEEALAVCVEALALESTSVSAWIWKCCLLNDLQRYEEALVASGQALQLDPTHVGALNWKGNVLTYLQRSEEALVVYAQALGVDATNATTWKLKGISLSLLQRVEQALEAFEQALKLDPRQIRSWEGKIQTLSQLQRYEEALVACEELLQLDPHNAGTWTSKGNLLLAYLQRYEEALAAYERALAVNPNSSAASTGKERALSQLKWQEALRAAHEEAFKDGTRSAQIFTGLNAIPWGELPQAYGSSEDVPVWLRMLTSSDEQVRRMAMGRLGRALEHQGSIYPATAYAVPYLIALLEEPTVLGKDEILGWLAAFYSGYSLDELMWYGEDGTESYGAWGEMPRHIPYKDPHAAIEAGIPVYLRLLRAPILIDRLEAAHVLLRFPARAEDLWPELQAVLEREPTETGKADLVLGLGRLAGQLPEKVSFFLDRFQTDQSELGRFAAALVVARMAKEAAPEEVMHLLVQVMLEAPSSLELYQRLPCGGTYPWSAALWALANLGPGRLAFLAPELEEHLQQRRHASAMEQELFARLLLFIVFAEPPHQGHPSRPAEALTPEQRQSLQVMLAQNQLWQYGNFSGLLNAFGVPGSRQGLAAYLGQTIETPPARVSRTQIATQQYDARMQAYGILIQSLYPDLPEHWGGPIQGEEGQDDDVLTDQPREVIIRFPRRADAVDAMEREAALLRALQGELPLPIPNPVYASQGTREVGRAFMGYHMLSGKPLYPELLESINETGVVQALAEQLALFLIVLHHIPVAHLEHLTLPTASHRDALETLYARAREELFPQMLPIRQAEITAQFGAFLENPEHFAVTPVLVHGNFGPETILYEAKERRISGVSDFSRACLGDPALDFARLVGPRGYSKAFLEHWAPHYPDLPTLLERARFYAMVVDLEEEWRKRSEQKKRASTPSPFPEIDRFFSEGPKMSAGEDEPPIRGNFY